MFRKILLLFSFSFSIFGATISFPASVGFNPTNMQVGPSGLIASNMAYIRATNAYTPEGELVPMQHFNSILTLTNYAIPASSPRLTATVISFDTTNITDAGLFFYSNSSTQTVDNGIVFAPSSGVGRWIRQYSGAINPAWFGAKGDGTTLDTAAMQLAVNAAKGGTIDLQNKVYLVENVILPSNIVVRRGTFKYPTNTTGFGLVYAQDGTQNVRLENITFDGNVLNQAVWSEFRHSVEILDAANVIVSGCVFTNTTGDGVYISHQFAASTPYIGSSNVWVINNLFSGTSTNRNGVSIICAKDVHVVYNTFSLMGRTGEPGPIDFEPDNTNEFVINADVGFNIFHGPTFSDGTVSSSHAVAVSDRSNAAFTAIKVHDNFIDGNFIYPIYGLGSTNHTDTIEITHNTIRDQLYPFPDLIRAIDISFCDGVVKDNYIANIFGAGIWSVAGNLLIENNTITNIQKQGIVLGAPVKGNIIGNRILNAGKFNSVSPFRGGIYFETSGVNFIDNTIISDVNTNSLYGFISPGGTNNYISGNYLSGIGNYNFNLNGAQKWGINTVMTKAASLDTLANRVVNLFDWVPTSDIVDFYLGGTNHGYFRSQDGVVRIIKGDSSAYSPFYMGTGSQVFGDITAIDFLGSLIGPSVITSNLTASATNLFFGTSVASTANPILFTIGGTNAGFVSMLFQDGIARFVKGDLSTYAGVLAGNVTSQGIVTANSFNLSTTNAIITGSGSPEGSFAYPVGSLYLRLDGNTNTTLYVKEKGGSGSTGWTPQGIQASGVTAGTYGDATHIPQITVTTGGLVSLVTTNTISVATGITNLTSAGTGKSLVGTVSSSSASLNSLTNGTFLDLTSNANTLNYEVRVAADGVSDSTKVVRSDDSRLGAGQVYERFYSGTATTTDDSTPVNAFNFVISGGTSAAFEVTAIANYTSGGIHKGYGTKIRGIMINFGVGSAAQIYTESTPWVEDRDALTPGGVTISNVAATQGGIQANVVGSTSKTLTWNVSIRYTPL